MKKSRGFPSSFNYMERDREGEKERGVGDGGRGAPDHPPPPYHRRYSEDYHNYPTAPRNYPLRGGDGGERGGGGGGEMTKEMRKEMRKSADEASLFRSEASNWRNEASNLRNEPPSYRNEPPNLRNEPPAYRNRSEPLSFRNEGSSRNEPLSFRNEAPNQRNEPPSYRNEPLGYRNEGSGYRSEAPNRNEPPNYRSEASNYRNGVNQRNEPPSYRNEPPSYRNEAGFSDPPGYRHGARGTQGQTGDRTLDQYRNYGSLTRQPPPAYNTHYGNTGEYKTTPRPDFRAGEIPSNIGSGSGGAGLGSGLGTGTGIGTGTGNMGTGSTSGPFTRNRYFRTAEDYHYDYRGGYRPPPFDTDGYTTDGSGSGYRDGSVSSGRGFENYRYPENQSLLDGSVYPRGEGGGGGGSEHQPFLGGSGGGSVEPVRLTPSWENSNLPKEELNFRSVNTYEAFEVGLEPPKDRYRLVFLTLVLHGVGTLMPWNMFITAKNYFVEYKLNTDDEELSGYSTNFLPYIGYASQIPNVLFNWVNIFVQLGGNLTTRIVWSIMVEVVVFVITVVLAMVDSTDWPGAFFWLTIASVVVLNVANGIYQNTVYGMAARLPFSYTGAVVLGSNISGTFTAVINIMAIAMAPNVRTSAIYYFITALFVLLACFDTYFALPLNRFFRYHEAMSERAQKSAKRGSSAQRVPYWHVFKSAFPQLFNVFMVFFVTLAVFPAVLADTCRTEENFPITPKYFQAVTCFLTFNVFAMLGNMLPGLVTWPGPRYLCVPVLLRIFFIPAFVLCHFYPVKVERIMPVLIDSDWAYWALAVGLGFTSGYYSSLAMMYCPRTVEPEYASVAGMMGAASLITGIFTGIVFQIVCTLAVTNISFEIPGYTFPFRNCTDRMLPAT